MPSTRFSSKIRSPDRNKIPKMKPEKRNEREKEREKKVLVKSFAHKQFKIINKIYYIKIQIRFLGFVRCWYDMVCKLHHSTRHHLPALKYSIFVFIYLLSYRFASIKCGLLKNYEIYHAGLSFSFSFLCYNFSLF